MDHFASDICQHFAYTPHRLSLYKLYQDLNGEFATYKAMLIARGFLQKPCTDCNEVYAPVAKLETIRIVVTVTTYKG